MSKLEEWKTFKEYVQLSDTDCALLKSVQIPISSKLPSVIDSFYQGILKNPTTNAIVANQEVVSRLKKTMFIWAKALFSGVYDEAYFNRQLRIGHVHLRVGLSNAYMLIAANGLRNNLYQQIRILFPISKSDEIQLALSKVIDLSLMVISESYLNEQEKSRLFEQQQLILSKLPLMVLSLDHNRKIIASTVAFQRQFSLEKGPYLNAFSPALLAVCPLPQLLDEIENTEKTKRLSFSFNSQSMRLTLTYIEHHQLRYIMLFENTTEIIQLERKNSQNENLAQIGRMAANLAHEIRNPIAGISSSLQILGKTFEDDQVYNGIIDQIQEKLQGINNLVTDLLLFSRPLQYNIQQIAIMELVQSILQDSELLIEIHHSAYKDPWGDRDRLRQVLMNLLLNAQYSMKELPFSERRILFFIKDKTEIYIIDNGSDIEDYLLPQLFTPFFTTKIQGTGLGLSISRKLLKGMGGEIKYISNDNKHISHFREQFSGACFLITLPCQPMDQHSNY